MIDPAAGTLVEAARRAFPLLRHVDARGFLVGGAIRDLLLGRPPRDADIAIAEAAKEAARFASRCGGRAVTLGEAPFDVVRVAAGGVVYDFAELVGATIEEDLGRRDFTIGAIAMPLGRARGLVDPMGGVADLRAATLRMVKEANFADDPLRVLRGARLVAGLGFVVEPETLAALRRHAPSVGRVAAERVGAEWLALLGASDAVAFRRGLELVLELGLDRFVVGGALSAAAIDRATRTGTDDPATRLAAIAWEGDESALCDAALRLGLGSSRVEAIRRAGRLARAVAANPASPIDPVAVHDEGADAATRAIGIVRAAGRDELAARLQAFVEDDGDRIFGARPLLDGHAIVAITGLEPGPRVGAIRRALLVAQLRGEVASEEQAREWVKKC